MLLFPLAATTSAASAAPLESAQAPTASSAAQGESAQQGPEKAKKAKEKLDKSAEKAAESVGVWYVDEASGTLVVEATNVAEAEAFVAESDAAADPVQVKKVADTPQKFLELVGGDAIYSSTGRCSIGFNARSATTTYVITAGHCTEGGGNWSGYERTLIGPVAASNFPNDDFGAIKVNSTATWTPTAKVKGHSTTVKGSTEAAIGASVCRSGSTTGYRCGVIESKNATVNYGNGDIVYGLTRTNACAEPGDSGGSFVAGTQAQGMTSGGSGNCSTGGTTYFQPINEALSRYGLTLVTG